MTIKKIFLKRILLVGCGKMGGALLEGWIKNGLSRNDIVVIEPEPSERLRDLGENGLTLNPDFAFEVGVCVLAIKPQNVDNLLRDFPKEIKFPLLISVIAGITIAKFRAAFGNKMKIFRAMPNTPSLVSAGVTAIYGQEGSTREDLEQVDLLMSSVGKTVRLKRESDIDAATAISGSGPAYAFLLIEAMAMTGIELGLSREVALKLAKNTVFGAGKLSIAATEAPEILRKNVTSPGGTTEAALGILMDNDSFKVLMGEAIKAAYNRSLELSK